MRERCHAGPPPAKTYQYKLSGCSPCPCPEVRGEALELSGLTIGEVAADPQFTLQRLHLALHVDPASDPVDVWQLRDYLIQVTSPSFRWLALAPIILFTSSLVSFAVAEPGVKWPDCTVVCHLAILPMISRSSPTTGSRPPSTARSPGSRRERHARRGRAPRHLHQHDRGPCCKGGLFIAIGHDLRTELVQGQLELDSEGCLHAPSHRARAGLPLARPGTDCLNAAVHRRLTVLTDPQRVALFADSHGDRGECLIRTAADVPLPHTVPVPRCTRRRARV
ncbi:DUF2316 family protein [Streptomyces sp. b84]|uniref:DUF2316 family protein n=1 Tax=Streptomyces sp. b84 TaxID=1827631 RepID=UPI0035A1892D